MSLKLSNRLCVTGWPSQVAPSLTRKVGALSRHGGFHKKIGITADPYSRARRHASDGWRRMELIYQSSSYSHVCQMERYLVDRFHVGVTLGGYHHNLVGGGGGRRPSRGPYFLYMIVSPSRSRMYH
jgi:hypothetical protein